MYVWGLGWIWRKRVEIWSVYILSFSQKVASPTLRIESVSFAAFWQLCPRLDAHIYILYIYIYTFTVNVCIYVQIYTHYIHILCIYRYIYIYICTDPGKSCTKKKGQRKTSREDTPVSGSLKSSNVFRNDPSKQILRNWILDNFVVLPTFEVHLLNGLPYHFLPKQCKTWILYDRLQ